MEQLQVVPYASEELALVLPVKHPMARLQELQKDDLYRLSFICLDAQSTTRKVVDQLLSRGGLDVQRLRIEMELNFAGGHQERRAERPRRSLSAGGVD